RLHGVDSGEGHIPSLVVVTRGPGGLDRLHDVRAAVAGHPHALACNPAIKVSTAAVLLEESIEGAE
ncbi:MAG: hypothetical protein ACRDJ9_27945, partial [Dehalococcoidia bacterium]